MAIKVATECLALVFGAHVRLPVSYRRRQTLFVSSRARRQVLPATSLRQSIPLSHASISLCGFLDAPGGPTVLPSATYIRALLSVRCALMHDVARLRPPKLSPAEAGPSGFF